MLQLHPSVIMNISEHHTRIKANRPECEIVIGALLGKGTAKNIEISDSFELRLIRPEADGASSGMQSTDTLLLDKEFFEKKVSLVKQVSADLELVGWYSTALPPSKEHMETMRVDSLHRQICDFIQDPIYVKLNPYKRESDPKISGTLPLAAFQPVRELIANEERINFTEVDWTIVTEDVEILGLEHSAKMTQMDVAPSTAIDYLRLQHSAIKMLRDRIKVITRFVKDVQSGSLPYHEEPLVDIVRLCQRFPLMNSDQYTRAYNMQCNDVALNTYLGILTKGSMCKMNFGKPNSKVRALSTTHARR